ncbi:MAG: AMP-binding protein, partial [Bryobacteraceae bacterium]|nr:AMP-binding protein [Bryobacteraceae bacterium]
MQALPGIESSQPEPVTSFADYPLSLGQRDVWMQSQLYPNGDVSKLSLMFSIWGPLEIPLFRQALQSLVDRHEILRTVFPGIPNGEPVQRVLQNCLIDCPLLDCSAVSGATDQEDRAIKIETAKQHANQQQTPAFDLANGPVLRARLLYFKPEWHCLVLSFHRLVLDGLHGAQLMNELGQTYRRLKRQEDPLAPPAVQYGEFSRLQQERLQGGQMETNRQFWLQRLREPLPETALPVDFDAPPQRTSETALHTHNLPVELTSELRLLQKRYRATAIQIATAAFAVLLQRTTGENEFLIAVPCSTRPRGMGGTIGFFSGILPLGIRVPQGISASALIEAVSRQFREAMDHREFSWTEALNSLRNRRGRNRSLLPVSVSQIGIVARKGAGEPGDLTMVGIGGYGSASSHELSVIVQEQSRLSLRFSYAKDLFDPATVENWGRYMETILKGFVHFPDTAVDQLPLVESGSPNEKPATPKSADEPALLDLFLSQVQRHPDAVAVTCGSDQLTYAALNRSANRYAHWLASRGLGTCALLLIEVENSCRMIGAILGAVKAGVCYALVRRGSNHTAEGIRLDPHIVSQEASNMPDHEPRKRVRGPMFADISGSFNESLHTTGEQGASRLVQADACWKLSSADTVLLTSTTGPSAAFGMWASLLNGARLVLAVERDLLSLGHILVTQNVS